MRSGDKESGSSARVIARYGIHVQITNKTEWSLSQAVFRGVLASPKKGMSAGPDSGVYNLYKVKNHLGGPGALAL